ncbi:MULTISPECIES: M20 metallopeptidase family protein [Facklamia]|uniref:Amidohydrolase n=2 Tax=Facklamia hominis TaxID=178214 RepID=K1LD26_9LACT|nr:MULTISPECIES: M20 family metallopeptidase [Facklamia]EKB54545.1 amidohydrolase [Facklamia hominis CCUG 36813]MDK7187522.1 M20 family metallopeptidase [Facklamia hominis]OFL65795.1 amidohydrolase [Facklamia sp. HMSC062C11]PKY93091.1 amidohydrolase [Facklamia hominis]RYC97680.1 M20/M25/M40 family metallo-hydrolase [Facklamia hominis]
MILSQEELEWLKALRMDLHLHPKVSEHEAETKMRLMNFIGQHSSVKLVDKGAYFYAIKDEGATETLAFRADMDSIVNSKMQAFHGCGHDGHSTILCGLILALDKIKTGKNIVYLFQHAEENGVGAKQCCEVLDEANVDRIYGLHNWPHLTKFSAHFRAGTLMCASTGMRLTFEGIQSHASEPEKGKNPIYAIAKLVNDWRPLSDFSGYQAMTFHGQNFSDLILCTVVSVRLGESNFGVSPGQGTLDLTLRAAKTEDLDQLQALIHKEAQYLADQEGLKLEMTLTDTFPDTSNSQAEVDRLKVIFKEAGLPFELLQEPIRSSEDFGWYLKKRPGCFFFLGDGPYAELHSDPYTFPDELIERGIELFRAIALG